MSLSFADTPEQAEFRGYVREWLRANCPTEPPPAEESAQVDFLRGWQRQLAGERQLPLSGRLSTAAVAWAGWTTSSSRRSSLSLARRRSSTGWRLTSSARR